MCGEGDGVVAPLLNIFVDMNLIKLIFLFTNFNLIKRFESYVSKTNVSKSFSLKNAWKYFHFCIREGEVGILSAQ